MKTIKVWSCCGAFGWFCPWGTWLAGSPRLMPADNESESYVYLFSCKGQLGDMSRAESVDPRQRPTLPTNCIGIVDLDAFIDPEGFKIDWDGAYHEIVRVADAPKEWEAACEHCGVTPSGRPSLEHNRGCPIKLRFYGGDPAWGVGLDGEKRERDGVIYQYGSPGTWVPVRE